MAKDKSSENMGRRVEKRLHELGWKQVDLLNRVDGLDAGTLSALITRNGLTSQWSDEIAEALGVTHRWLQRGVEPKMREEQAWPFRRVTRNEFAKLDDYERAEVEGYVRRILDSKPNGDKSMAA